MAEPTIWAAQKEGETGRQVAEHAVAAIHDGHLWLLRCATRFERRRWAVEDCWHLAALRI